MNNPEYILTDELETIVTAVKTALGISVLNYQYGYLPELNETLKQMEGDPAKFAGKFPLVWLAEPYEIARNTTGIYGIANPDIFIFMATDKTYKAKDRMNNVYKPVLYPVYRELLNQIVLSPVFQHPLVSDIKHTVRKGYYWDEQRQVFNDAVDCLKISGLSLRINDKQNCTFFTNM